MSAAPESLKESLEESLKSPSAVHHDMPYFVYRVSNPLRLTHVETKERYQDARALVRSLREARNQETEDQYRLVFAKHQAEAETLLSTPRDDRVIGED